MSPLKDPITVQATIDAPIEVTWKCWNDPADIMQWNQATPEWHTSSANNDLREGGKFSYYMAAKDGSMGFDFWGTYIQVIDEEKIVSEMGDGRRMQVDFESRGNQTVVTEQFEAESVNSRDMQRAGWQAILDSFRKFVENK